MLGFSMVESLLKPLQLIKLETLAIILSTMGQWVPSSIQVKEPYNHQLFCPNGHFFNFYCYQKIITMIKQCFFLLISLFALLFIILCTCYRKVLKKNWGIVLHHQWDEAIGSNTRLFWFEEKKILLIRDIVV